jgi:hypothetical protein
LRNGGSAWVNDISNVILEGRCEVPLESGKTVTVKKGCDFGIIVLLIHYDKGVPLIGLCDDGVVCS